MKVILIKDVKGIGRAHETIEAKDGYVINYLIPKKLAVFATTGSTKEAQGRQKHSTEQHALTNKLLEQNIAALADARIVITAKANEKGHLYDAVGEPEILKAAHEQAHIELPKDALKLEKPIKALGTFAIPVSVGEVFGTFSITVEAEM
jgi:large subunit ribosomal protein L9